MEIVIVDSTTEDFQKLFRRGAPKGCKAFDYMSVAKRVKVDPELNPDLLDAFVLKRIRRAISEKGIERIYYKGSNADERLAQALREHVKRFFSVDPETRIADIEEVKSEIQ